MSDQEDDKKQTFVTGEEDDKKEEKSRDGSQEPEESDGEKQKREEEEAAEAEKIRQEEEVAKKRQEQAVQFEEYVEQSGLKYGFQIIFTEIISNQIREDQVFAYTAMRLRQIGSELDNLEKGALKEES
mmetsp:Transcript_13785/g.12220  ORF Transcript_13785/g.12220 Transcript_13785/m.12220 type:complete len:128 (+) Transcript_13785:23-406(+)